MCGNKEKIKILIVDDEIDFLESTGEVLERRGFDVYKLDRGSLVQSWLERDKFDIVLLDIKMPGKNGIDVLHRIKKRWPKMPIIIITGHGSLTQAFQMSKKGIADYIAKPFHIDDLVKSIDTVTQKANNYKT